MLFSPEALRHLLMRSESQDQIVSYERTCKRKPKRKFIWICVRSSKKEKMLNKNSHPTITAIILLWSLGNICANNFPGVNVEQVLNCGVGIIYVLFSLSQI